MLVCPLSRAQDLLRPESENLQIREAACLWGACTNRRCGWAGGAAASCGCVFSGPAMHCPALPWLFCCRFVLGLALRFRVFCATKAQLRFQDVMHA